MSNMWDYGSDVTTGAELTGYGVEATDGSIGHVDEATYEVGSSYIVVDTGPWIFGQKVLLPAGVITSIDHDDEVVRVSRTKDEIKSAPRLDEHQGHQDDAVRRPIGDYYGTL